MVNLSTFLALSLASGLGESAGTACAWNWQCGGRCGSNWQCTDAADGVRCLLHDDCRSKYCTWKFKCHRQMNDHEFLGLPIVDYRPCKSDWGRCGTCLPHGAKLRNGAKCTYDADCVGGVCGRDGHPTVGCLGTCRNKFNDNEKCDNDVNCKSGYCSSVWGNFGKIDENDDIDSWPEVGELFVQRCRRMKDLHQYVGANGLTSNSGECKSKHAVCGYCSPKNAKNWNLNGHWCSNDGDCKSGVCFPDNIGITKLCNGKCGDKKPDGHYLGWSLALITGGDSVDYGKFCKSGRGVCGTCSSSRKNPPGGKCADSADCQEGSYCGRTGQEFTTKFCNGICKKKVPDNGKCDFWAFDGGDLWEGESEACENFPRSICRVLGSFKLGKAVSQRATCQPKDGGRKGAPCMVDSHCHKDFFCRDGNFVNGVGECSECPGWCGKHGRERGCNMCANKEENLECGERTWTEETKCFIETVPTFLADVFTAYASCLATAGLAGVHDRDEPGGGLLKDLIGEQDLFKIGQQCINSADDCNIELWHTKEYKADESGLEMLQHLTGRRLLAGEHALVAEGSTDDMLRTVVPIKQTARRTFGFGSRRRLQEEHALASVDLEKFGGKSIEEICKDLPPGKREEYKKDLEEFTASRKAVLTAEPEIQESENFDGDVAVENHVDMEFDPDFVLNPRKRTLKGTVGVTGTINGEIKFNGEGYEGGKLKISKPLMSAIPFISQVVNTGYIPIYIELFFQPVIEIEATMDAPIDAAIEVNGDFVYNGNVDVDLRRSKGDRFKLTQGKGSLNKLDITPKNLGNKAINMKFKARVVPRLVFLVFTASGVQLDLGVQVEAELNLKPEEAADGTGADCIDGDFAITSTSLVVRPVYTALNIDANRAIHGACYASMASVYSLFSVPGLIARFQDCGKKAWLKKSDQETLMALCDGLKPEREVIDVSEGLMAFTPGYLNIYKWKHNSKAHFHICDGIDQNPAGTHLG